ncbi:MAG TPA: hypothetical protein VEB67_01980, partial [Nitrososphaerales archaeon]|nr:hypothetical protein [Nitrososphaerales archaeon]
VESLLTTVLMFSIFRPTMPEQWALYPLAFLLVSLDAEGRSHFTAIAVVATAFLATNNFLLVRFFSPLSQAALSWDSMLDSASSLTEVRYALMLVFSVFFSAEALSIVFRKRSILSLKLRRVRLVPPRAFAFPIGYLAMVAVTGGLLDFTATKMVTDWALAIESSVFLGLSWLSLYHVMLVVVFETMTMFIVLYSRRGLQGSARLFLLLTFLNVAASGLSLVLYRALEGVPLLESTTIYLLSSAYLTEEGFVVFTLTLAFLGIFFLDELVAGLRRLALGAAHIPELTSRSDIANSIPPSA